MTIDVIVAYAVGERSQEDGWKKLCMLLHNTPISDDIHSVLKNIEEEYKAKFAAPLPAAYRSAKSTALKAYELGVDLLDAEGNVKGKTAVAKECKSLVPVAAKSRDIPSLVSQINVELRAMDDHTRAAYLVYVRTNVEGLL